MSDFRDRFERQLVDAADRLAAEERAAGSPSARRARRWPRGLVAGLAAVAIGLAFVVAFSQTPTRDQDGSSAGHVPDAPPRAQLEALGVLRRAATAADRGPEAAAALEGAGGPVRKRFVRRLPAPKGSWVFLLSMPTYRQRGLGETAESIPSGTVIHDALCLRSSHVPRQGYTEYCFTGRAVRRGRAVAYWGLRRLALVPDGVASVAMHRTDGRIDRVPVVDNFYMYGSKGADGRPRAGVWSEWLDADGRPIPKGR